MKQNIDYFKKTNNFISLKNNNNHNKNLSENDNSNNLNVSNDSNSNNINNHNNDDNNILKDDELNLLKIRLMSQTNLMKEYENWINILLSIVGDNPTFDDDVHYDMGTPIQKGLEKIEKLQEENLKIKEKLINESKKNENYINIIEEKKKDIQFLNNYKNEIENNIKRDNKILKNNIQIFANEIDDLIESNKQFQNIINNNRKLKENENLINKYKKLKETNLNIKKLIEVHFRKNCLNYGNTNNLKKYINNPYVMRNLGNFQIENDEKIDNVGWFGCG
jgi:hypothetical protein